MTVKTDTSALQRLLEHINGMTVPEQKAFADRCDTTIGQIRQVCYGNRGCSPELAVALDRETRSKVSMTDLAPHIDWNHVRKVMRRR